MIKYLIILTIMFYSTLAFAGAWQWAQEFGSQGMERPWDLAVDYAQSDIFVSGEFTDSLRVDGTTYYGNGLSDCFIIKYNEQGQTQWVNTFGSSEGDVCLSVSTDGSGNCYFTGYFIGTMTWGTQTIQGNGMWDVFYGKLNPEGDLLWLKSFGGPLNDIGYGIAATSSGDFCIAGWFADAIVLGTGVEITSFGGSDIFVAKFDSDGNPLWARHAGTVGVEYGYKVDVSASGDSYVTGSASPGSSFDSIVSDTAGMFVAKYDTFGTVQWVLPSYGAGVNNISVDQSTAYSEWGMVVGRVTGTAMIGDAFIQTVDNTDDMYCARFSASGEWTGVQHFGGPGSDKGRGIDAYGDYAAIGSFEDTVDFDSTPLSSIGAEDIAIVGSGFSAQSAGSINSDIGTDIKLLSNGRVLITGWYSGTLRFGEHVLNSQSDTNLNGFVALYDSNASATDDNVNALLGKVRCYPNPGKGAFTLEAENAQVVRIFNSRGQLVRKLDTRETKDGISYFNWDSLDNRGKTCPPGVYLAKTSQVSAKLVLLK